MLRQLVCVFAVFAVASASPLKVSENNQRAQFLRTLVKENGNANLYMDLVLRNLNALLPETVPIPDFGGVVEMTNCYIFGLDSGISRVGDATMLTIEDTVKFTCGMGTATIGMRCDWRYGFLINGDCSGTTDVISISSGISWKLVSGNSPQLTEFRVTELAPIETDITGLTPLFNWLAEDIANMIINDFASAMISVVESLVKDLFQQVLDGFVLP